jgi:hypothetical protein
MAAVNKKGFSFHAICDILATATAFQWKDSIIRHGADDGLIQHWVSKPQEVNALYGSKWTRQMHACNMNHIVYG